MTTTDIEETSTRPLPRHALLRWFASYGTFSVPAAAGPIAFSLLALPLTGDAENGAAIVLALTLAQVIGAVPVTRLGERWNAVSYLRLLVVIRTLALVGIGLLAMVTAPFYLVLAAAAVAGLVNGAAYGYLRSVLNSLVNRDRLPRSLGIASTLNEFTFVAAPVLASVLGIVSPLVGVFGLALLGAAPLLLLPTVPTARMEGEQSNGQIVTPPILLWLACTAAGGTAVASIEIGAVSLAIGFGLEPGMGFLFTVALCVASVAGGVWVSVRNEMPAKAEVMAYLCVSMSGAALVASNGSVGLTIIGAVLIGLVLAPLGTFYSLMLDDLAPPSKRAEVFALLRSANAIGIICTSAILTLAGLTATLWTGAFLMAATTATVALASIPQHRNR